MLSFLSIPTYGTVIIAIGTFIIGLVVGFFVSRFVFKKYLKKNPPVTENMIRVMLQQMGRTPSEKQVRAVMKSMNDAK